MPSSGEVELKVDEDGKMGDEGEKKDEEDQTPPATLKQLYVFTSANDKLLLLFAALCATGSGIAMPMMLIAFGDAFEQLGVSETLPGQNVLGDKMDEMLLTFAYIAVGIAAGKFFYVGIVSYVCSSQVLSYKVEFLKAVLRQEVAWYDASSPEALSTKFGDNIVKIQSGLSAQTFVFFEGFGYGFGSLIMAFVYDWRVAGITMLTIPLLAGPAYVAMDIVTNGSAVIKKAYETAGGVATEALFSMKTVMSLGIEKQIEEKYKNALGGAKKAFIKNQTMFGCSVGSALSAYLIMMVVAMIFGVVMLTREMEKSAFDLITTNESGDTSFCSDNKNNLVEWTPGSGTCPATLQPYQMSCQTASALVLVGVDAFNFTSEDSFREYVQREAPEDYIDDNSDFWPCKMDNVKILVAILAIMMAGEGMGMIGQPFQVVTEARIAAAKILEVINRKPTIDSFSEEGSKPDKCNGEIKLENVVFSYPTAPNITVLNNINLHCPSGKSMALVGSSGSGKSTVIQLLERFYDPISGTVSLDGTDIKTLNVRWLRSQVGLVSQEPVLFQGSVAQNISYGMVEAASQDDIEKAAKQANAHDFISKDLESGYNTEVGQGGSKLSGGQKQRVAIARALIKKPSVLLLDEATAALDNIAEAAVQATLENIVATEKLTTVIIAHRLTTIRHADCISVLTNGSLVEQGTYDDLYGRGGVFHALAKKQGEMIEMGKKQAEASGAGEPKQIPVVAFSEVANDSATVSGVTYVKVEEKAAVDAGKGNEKGEKEKKKEEEAEISVSEQLKVVGRLFKLQNDKAVHLTLMFLFSAGACICPSVAFYQLTRVMSVLFGPDPDQMRDDTIEICTLMGIMAAATIAGFTASHFFNGIAGSALTAKLRGMGMTSLLRQEMAFFDIKENSATVLTGFLSEKVDKVMMLTTEQLDLIAQLLGGVTSAMVIILWLCSWQLALAWAAVVPVMAIAASAEMAFISGGEEEDNAKKGKVVENEKTIAEKSANQIVGECVTGIRTVASYNLEHKFFAQYKSTSGTVSEVMKRDAFIKGFFGGFSMGCIVAIMGGLFWFAIWLANEGYIDFTQAMGPMFVITGAFVPMMKAGALADIKQSTLSAIRLFKVVDGVPSIKSDGEGGERPSTCRGEIHLQNVVFAYPTASGHNILNHMSLHIPAGQTTALCGPSGSGKSTVIQLLERFYDPTSGVVTLDGNDLKSLNVRWLRSQLGYVGQEPVLFQGTVTQNIAYGKLEDTTQEEIEEAAKQANAHDFIISKLTSGYATEVGLKGDRLSGGQKQRVAIARALIKKPSVLLLDEATAQLDNIAESEVQVALDEVMKKGGMTTVVIAHRLTTIQGADCIVVINDGKVLEKGKHAELIANQSLYANLVMSNS